MSLYTQFETDAKLEKEGILLEYGLNSKGQPIAFRIARAGGSNQAYLNRMEVKAKPHRRQIQNETADRVTLEKLVREVYAETVVIGWENVEDRAGDPIPFTRDNCLKLFNDLPDLFADIQEQAQKGTLYRKTILEADAKN